MNGNERILGDHLDTHFTVTERRGAPRFPIPQGTLRNSFACHRLVLTWFLGDLRAIPCQVLSVSRHGISFITPQEIDMAHCLDISARWEHEFITFPACFPVHAYPVNQRCTVWNVHAVFDRDRMSAKDAERLDHLCEILIEESQDQSENLHFEDTA